MSETTPAIDEPDQAGPARRFSLGGLTLRQAAARGTIVNAVFLTSLSGLGLVRGFVLAHFLTREDYGIWGVLVISLGTLLWLKQVGVGDKYIQQDDPDQELAFQKAFTLEALFMGVFILLVAAAVPLMVVVYGESDLLLPGFVIVAILPALALQAPLWVFYRQMQFVRQRALQAVDPIVGFVVAIGLAVAGAGYWAIILGVLTGAWAAAIVAILASPYKLRFRYDRGTLRSYASFSWPLILASGTGVIVAQATILVSEKQLGLAGAGAIALAATISQFTDRVDAIVTGTLYPAICAVRDRTELLLESFIKSNRLALLWAFPFGIGLTLFAPDLVDFAIGERWEPATVVIQAFGFGAAVNHIGFNWDAYFRAREDTKPIAVVATASMVAYLVLAIPLLLTDGLRGFAIAVAAQTVVGVSMRAFFLRRLFPGFQVLRHAARAIAPTLPATAVVLGMRAIESGERTALLAAGELAAYIVVTAAATLAFERALLREAVGYLRARPA